MKCPKCKSTAVDQLDCPMCDGTGEDDRAGEVCGMCDGTGKADSYECMDCYHEWEK